MPILIQVPYLNIVISLGSILIRIIRVLCIMLNIISSRSMPHKSLSNEHRRPVNHHISCCNSIPCHLFFENVYRFVRPNWLFILTKNTERSFGSIAYYAWSPTSLSPRSLETPKEKVPSHSREWRNFKDSLVPQNGSQGIQNYFLCSLEIQQLCTSLLFHLSNKQPSLLALPHPMFSLNVMDLTDKVLETWSCIALASLPSACPLWTRWKKEISKLFKSHS